MKQTPWDAIFAAIFLLAAAASVWQWQQTTLQRKAEKAGVEPWRHVRERYPMPETFGGADDRAASVLQSIVRANPFSPMRRQAPPEEHASNQPAAPPPPPPAQFVFKGRVSMGTTQRAVLEDLTTHKTYFLQVGQEVAGFKVLDIEENRVLLSDLHKQEELTIALTQSSTQRAGMMER